MLIHLPELDGKVNVDLKYGYSPSDLSHGCMTSGLANICAMFNLEYLQKITDNTVIPMGEQRNKLINALNKYKFTETQLCELFRPVAERFHAPIVLIADRINTGASMYTPHTAYGYLPLKTVDFVEWLIRNQQGIVITGPVALNPGHVNPAALSLTQAFIWTPPSALRYVIAHSEQAFYPTTVPKPEDWAKNTQEAIRNTYKADWEGNYARFVKDAFRDSILFQRARELNLEGKQEVVKGPMTDGERIGI